MCRQHARCARSWRGGSGETIGCPAYSPRTRHQRRKRFATGVGTRVICDPGVPDVSHCGLPWIPPSAPGKSPGQGPARSRTGDDQSARRGVVRCRAATAPTRRHAAAFRALNAPSLIRPAPPRVLAAHVVAASFSPHLTGHNVRPLIRCAAATGSSPVRSPAAPGRGVDP